MLGRQLGDDRGAETLPEVEQSRRRHVGVLDEEVAGRAHVERQPLLAGTARVAAVPAVVEEEYRETRLVQRLGQRGAIAPVAGVAVRHEDGGCAVPGREVPGTEVEA